ncbi:DUF6203 family protein [Nonomuraea sp. NPDC050404]|uniref:DUF6203 family protein n=1 Tax=Nonomuraea sp. NPDC050404 TaxID=3155783 RepID=UPI0033F2190F
MKKLFKLLLARKMAKTPIGLAALAIGWYLARHRRQKHADHEDDHTKRATHDDHHRRRPVLQRRPY